MREFNSGNMLVLQNNPGTVISRITINLPGLFCKGSVFERMIQNDESIGMLSFALTYNRKHITKKKMRNYIGDIVSFIKEVEKEYPGIPVTLRAHSMGALLAQAALRHVRGSVASMVLIAPAVPRGFWPARFGALVRLIKYLPQLLWHHKASPGENDAHHLMAKGMPQQDVDHFCSGLVPESAYVLWQNIIPWMRKQYEIVSVPTFVVIAVNDKTIPPKSQRDFAFKINADTRDCDCSHAAPLYDVDIMHEINRWSMSRE